MAKSRATRFTGQMGGPAGSYEALVDEGQECRSRMRLHAYDSESYQVREDVGLEALEGPLDGPVVRWLEVCGLCDVALMKGLVKRLGLHPLVMEDVMNPDVRPKAEEHEGLLQVCAKIPREDGERLSIGHFSLLLMPSLVVTFSSGQESCFSRVVERLEAKESRARSRGADYLSHVLLDVVVDHFILVSKSFEDAVDALQGDVDAEPEDLLRRIGGLKKRVVSLRREAMPMQAMSLDLKGMDGDVFGKEVRPYLRDLHDHTSFVLDSLERSREVLMELQQLQLALISQRMNDIMRILTMVATIFIPLTFVTGFYGMNFDLPQLAADMGHLGALILMAAIALGMIAMFRRKGWL